MPTSSKTKSSASKKKTTLPASLKSLHLTVAFLLGMLLSAYILGVSMAIISYTTPAVVAVVEEEEEWRNPNIQICEPTDCQTIGEEYLERTVPEELRELIRYWSGYEEVYFSNNSEFFAGQFGAGPGMIMHFINLQNGQLERAQNLPGVRWEGVEWRPDGRLVIERARCTRGQPGADDFAEIGCGPESYISVSAEEPWIMEVAE
jgi:hypothetical protein